MQTRRQRSERPAAWKHLAGKERILQRVRRFVDELPEYERIAMEEGLTDPVDACVGSFGWDVYRLVTSPPGRTAQRGSEGKAGPIELKQAKADREILRLAAQFGEDYRSWLLLLEQRPLADYGRKCIEEFAEACLAAISESLE